MFSHRVRQKIAFTSLLLLLACPSLAAQFSKEWIQVGHMSIEVELALTPSERAQGLMGRENVQTGMLFLDDAIRPMAFWMYNTPSPLDIAYLKSDWTLEPVQALTPFDTTAKPSKGPVRGALEMPQGWFEKHGVAAGALLKRCGKTPCKSDP